MNQQRTADGGTTAPDGDLYSQLLALAVVKILLIMTGTHHQEEEEAALVELVAATRSLSLSCLQLC